MLYAITAQILTSDGDYQGSRQVPTFYLDSVVSGITDINHAARIGKSVVDPMGTLKVSVDAYAVGVECCTQNTLTPGKHSTVCPVSPASRD